MSNRAKDIAAIMAGYEAGQEWEYRDKSVGKWNSYIVHPSTEPSWNWELRDYRRKPTPKTRTRPMTFDELPPCGTIIKNEVGWTGLITSRNPITERVRVGGDYIDLESLKFYTFLDTSTNTWLPFTITETIYE